MKLLKNLTLCICIILSISLIGCSSKTTVQSSSSTKVTENKNTDEKSEDQESFTCSMCNKKYPISEKASIKNVEGAVVATGCKSCIAKLPQDADDSGDPPINSNSSTKKSPKKQTTTKKSSTFTCPICNKKYPISEKRSIKNVEGAVVATGCKSCIAKLPQDADDSGDTPSKKYECGICGGDSRYCDCCRECGNTAEDCICYDSEVQGGEDF